MFIIRAIFWLSIVLLLIPGEVGGKTGAGAADALLAARGVVADLSGICDRQPDVCVHGGAALQAIGAKAWQNASALVEHFDGREAAPAPAEGTLTPVDAQPAWRAAPGNPGKA